MKRNDFAGRLVLFLGAAGIFFMPGPAPAAYPEKPVILNVGFSAGGPTDIIARQMAETMKKYFPQPLVVVNKVGAAGALATSEAIQAKPDGYTISFSTMTSLTIQPHRIKLPYKAPDSYTAISMVASFPFTMLVRSDAPWNTFRELIEYARAHPGKVRVAHSGVGHITHLIMEDLKMQAKIDLTLVPYPGGVEMVAAILGGHAEAMPIGTETAVNQVQGKKMKILAVFDERRNPHFPDTPTSKELGYDITKTTYSVLLGAKNLPPEAVNKLQDAYKKVSEDPAFLEPMKKLGVTVHYEGSKDITKRLWEDYRYMEKILDRVGLKGK